MNKKKLVLAILICTAFSVPAYAMDRQIDNPSISNETFTNLTFNGDGGAVINTIDSVINDSSFDTNNAKYGGAIYNTGNLTVNGGSFTNNTAIYWGGAVASNDGNLTINSPIFQGNSANSGGAITSRYTNLTIGDGVKFIDNHAKDGYGGAISLIDRTGKNGNHTVTIGNNVLFEKNTAEGSKLPKGTGGAINIGNAVTNVTIGQNAIFTENTASIYGGAIYNQGALLTLGEGAKFTSNTAQRGGAIFQNANQNLTLNNATFKENHAIDKDMVSAGGAIYIAQTSNQTINIINSEFTGNTSGGAGGAILQADGSKATIIINHSNFDGNIALTEGGAIVSDSILNVLNSKFEGNKTTSTSASDDGGGAIFLYDEGKATISGSTFTSNISGTYGGAIGTRPTTSSDKSSLTVENSTFTDNTATLNGGAIMANVNTVVKGNSSFNENKATNGGAIYNVAELTVSATDFNKNTANSGGAIYNNAGTLTISDNSSFTGNVSNGLGGAIVSWGGGATSITDTSFSGNTAATHGGAVFGNGGTITINNSDFSTNSCVSQGGAIHTSSTTSLEINKTVFTENNAQSGGAITAWGDLKVSGSEFTNNYGDSKGGAIYANNVIDISDSKFTNNYLNASSSDNFGGALYFSNKSSDVASTITNTIFENNRIDGENGSGGAVAANYGTLNIENTDFLNNSARDGGAMYVLLTHGANDVTVKNSNFTGNTASSAGAIGNFGKLSIYDSYFSDNHSTSTLDDDGGGALFLGAESNTLIQNSIFNANTSQESGGAITTRSGDNADNSAATLDILNSTFTNNTAVKDGGAIYNTLYNSTTENGTVTIADSVFDNNHAGGNGGAVYNALTDKAGNIAEITLTDSSFTNNSADGKGGAVFANGDLTVNSKNSDVIFSGNSASDGNDIYMNAAGSDLNLNAAADKSITFASGISGENYNMIVNADSTNTGSVIINSAIKNATIDVANGTFHLSTGSSLDNSTLNMASGTTLNTINNEVNSFGNNITLADNVNLAVDVNLTNGEADNFSNVVQNGAVSIVKINPLGASQTTENNITINLAQAMGIDPSQLAISEAFQAQTVLTPIRYLQGSITSDGMLTYAPTGNGYRDFNPSVMASPIAAQIGGYLTQLNSYDEAFRNMDMYMLLTKQQRQALKLRNKFAAADSSLIFDPTNTPYDNNALWVRPYATFENVPLKGGPRVSNVAYGSFFGGESPLYELGNGWDAMWGLYVGYNGSHQAYDGISIYQNGGTLGAVGMAYKGNFFSGLTINAGANAGEASTMYGNDNFSMLMAGIASKTGYNFELADGKFIIQPNLLLSYSFVNTFDYTNAAGVRIDSDPLHAIQIEPGLKFIGNLKNGWQPYLGVSMVWNIIDKTHFHANDVALPELSVKPYVKYGVGIRKTWGERFTGFLQAFITNGGRNGVGLQLGFRWALGKNPSSYNSQAQLPPKQKTVIKISASGK